DAGEQRAVRIVASTAEDALTTESADRPGADVVDAVHWDAGLDPGETELVEGVVEHQTEGPCPVPRGAVAAPGVPSHRGGVAVLAADRDRADALVGDQDGPGGEPLGAAGGLEDEVVVGERHLSL